MLATADFTRHVPSAHAGLILPQRREVETWSQLPITYFTPDLLIFCTVDHLKFFIARASAPNQIDDIMRNVAWNPWMVWFVVKA